MMMKLKSKEDELLKLEASESRSVDDVQHVDQTRRYLEQTFLGITVTSSTKYYVIALFKKKIIWLIYFLYLELYVKVF